MLPALRFQFFAPVPVIEARLGQPRAHGEESALLGDPDVGIGRVGDEKEIKRRGLARAFDVLVDGLHGGKHAAGASL